VNVDNAKSFKADAAKTQEIKKLKESVGELKDQVISPVKILSSTISQVTDCRRSWR
jgi:hypothetical protein